MSENVKSLLPTLLPGLCHFFFEWVTDLPMTYRTGLATFFEQKTSHISYFQFLYKLFVGEKSLVVPNQGIEFFDRKNAELKVFVEQGNGAEEPFEPTTRVTLSGKTFMRLTNDSEWMNDDILTEYFQLLNFFYPDSYVFSNFFVVKWNLEGYAGVRRWTRKIDLRAYRRVFFPLHLEMHWAFIEVDLETHFIRYFDSLLGAEHMKYLRMVHSYLEQEWRDKGYGPLTAFQLVHAPSPQQRNGHDCGVYVMNMIEYRIRGLDVLSITPEDIVLYRKKVFVRILSPYDYFYICPVWPETLRQLRENALFYEQIHPEHDRAWRSLDVNAGKPSRREFSPDEDAESVPDFIELFTESGYNRIGDREIVRFSGQSWNDRSVWLSAVGMGTGLITNVSRFSTLYQLAQTYLAHIQQIKEYKEDGSK